MSIGFWMRSFITLLAGASIVLGVAYEDKLIAFEQRLAVRWQRAWERNFGEAAYDVTRRPANVQARAISYRTCFSSQIEVVHGNAVKPEYDLERREELNESAQEAKAKSA